MVNYAGTTAVVAGPLSNRTVFSKPDVTATTQGGAWTTANNGLTLFTITGFVRFRVFGRVTTAITSTAGTGTLGITNTAAATTMIAATTANGTTNFILNSVWQDNAPTLVTKAFASANDLGWLSGTTNIILAIVTNNMTAGGMDIVCEWTPLTAGSTVV